MTDSYNIFITFMLGSLKNQTYECFRFRSIIDIQSARKRPGGVHAK
jgi:hypothetical protein